MPKGTENKEDWMQQELKGFFVALCPACRYREPVFVGGAFRWRCEHRQVSVVETADRRLLTVDQGSHAAIV